jgi:hypothetical protein
MLLTLLYSREISVLPPFERLIEGVAIFVSPTFVALTTLLKVSVPFLLSQVYPEIVKLIDLYVANSASFPKPAVKSNTTWSY